MTHEKLLQPEPNDNQLELGLTENDLFNSLEQGEKKLVIAEVDCWDYKRRGLRVHFGRGLLGYIPEQEITIKNLTYKNSMIPIQASSIIYHFIIAEVIDVNIARREFILSRKSTMRKAFMKLSKGDTVYGKITNITDKSFFVDVGAGNIGRLPLSEFSTTNYHSAKNAGYYIGDFIQVVITDIVNTDMIELGHKSLFPSYSVRKEEFSCGDLVYAIIASRFYPRDGDTYQYSYLVEIEPNVTGILNTDIRVEYGSRIECVIAVIKEQGLKLRPRAKQKK